jgi:hypothetical protein
MDAVIGAHHVFAGALEALESSDVEEDRAERLVHDACSAVDALCDAMKGVEGFKVDFGGQSMAWARAVYTSWESVASEHRGVKVAQKLDSVAPNLCASWLDALKSLASCAVVAKRVIARQRDSTELGREDPRANFNSANVSEETLEGEESWNWIGKDFLSTFWPELRDRGGLRSARWRARLSAAEFLSSLAEYDLDGEKSNNYLLSLLEELLQSLIFEMALVDSQWQVLKHFFQSYSLSHVRNYMTNGRV